jgi:hypothetical protein
VIAVDPAKAIDVPAGSDGVPAVLPEQGLFYRNSVEMQAFSGVTVYRVSCLFFTGDLHCV